MEKENLEKTIIILAILLAVVVVIAIISNINRCPQPTKTDNQPFSSKLTEHEEARLIMRGNTGLRETTVIPEELAEKFIGMPIYKNGGPDVTGIVEETFSGGIVGSGRPPTEEEKRIWGMTPINTARKIQEQNGLAELETETESRKVRERLFQPVQVFPRLIDKATKVLKASLVEN